MLFFSRVQQVADPRGRCNRKGLLGVAIALLSLQALALAAWYMTASPPIHVLAGVVKIGCVWIAASAAIKRLHDLGLSGWWLPVSFMVLLIWSVIASFFSLLAFGPAVLTYNSFEFMIYASAVMIWPVAGTLWLHFAKGDEGHNRYGAPPDAMEDGAKTDVALKPGAAVA